MKDIKRRSFLKSVIGSLTALFSVSATGKEATGKEVNPIYEKMRTRNCKPIQDSERRINLRRNEILEPSTKPLFDDLDDLPRTQDAAFMKDDQRIDEQIRRMVAQYKKTMDKLCIKWNKKIRKN